MVSSKWFRFLAYVYSALCLVYSLTFMFKSYPQLAKNDDFSTNRFQLMLTVISAVTDLVMILAILKRSKWYLKNQLSAIFIGYIACLMLLSAGSIKLGYTLLDICPKKSILCLLLIATTLLFIFCASLIGSIYKACRWFYRGVLNSFDENSAEKCSE